MIPFWCLLSVFRGSNCLRDLQSIASGIAHVETLHTFDGTIVGEDLDTCLAEAFFGFAEIVNRVANVAFTAIFAGALFD